MTDIVERLRTFVDRAAIAHEAADEIERLRAELAASQAREASLLEFIQHAPVSSGVCCCGESMDRHSDPMMCGHSPTDEWDWSVHCLIEDAKKHDDTPLKERLKQERERVADYVYTHSSYIDDDEQVTFAGYAMLAAAIRAMGDE